LCDGRVPERNKNFCPIKQSMCKKQRDFFGNQCVFKRTKNWKVPINGSPCRF
jgi:hypothetical protein